MYSYIYAHDAQAIKRTTIPPNPPLSLLTPNMRSGLDPIAGVSSDGGPKDWRRGVPLQTRDGGTPGNHPLVYRHAPARQRAAMPRGSTQPSKLGGGGVPGVHAAATPAGDVQSDWVRW